MNTEITYEEQIDLDHKAIVESKIATYVDLAEVSYEEKRRQSDIETSRALGLQFGLEAGKYLASIGVQFRYTSPKTAATAVKFRG
jgi:hypothetical protein